MRCRRNILIKTMARSKDVKLKSKSIAKVEVFFPMRIDVRASVFPVLGKTDWRYENLNGTVYKFLIYIRAGGVAFNSARPSSVERKLDKKLIY